MNGEVLIIGYGSIGKRHARNLLNLGIAPYVLTKHPDKLNVKFLEDIKLVKDKNIRHCIISSSTAKHLDDMKRCAVSLSKLKNVLIEKPLESSFLKGKKIRDIARTHNLKVSIAYNMRFLKIFDIVKKFTKHHKKKIRIIEVVAGQDLREWRPCRDITCSYSAHRKLGGGVDMDLSHEIDYILWLFGIRFKNKMMYRAKISDLKIKSPDIFKLVLGYNKFIADISLDYIRKPKERYLKIFCDTGKNLHYDFVKDELKIDGKLISNRDNDNMGNSYKRMLEAFLGINKVGKAELCSLEEALNVLKVLEV